LGAAVLASLYRALDHKINFNQDNIVGCTLLLQCLAWERLTCISPQLQPLTDEEVQQRVGFPLGKRYVVFLLIFKTIKQSS